MAKNTHSVPKHQWRKWSPIEQGMFNRVWNKLTPEYLSCIGVHLDRKTRGVIRWNLSWTMAQMYKDYRGWWK